MQKKTIAIGIIIVALGLGILAGMWYLQTPSKKYTGPPEPISLGVTPYQTSTLIWVADNQHFFAENGLNVTMKTYDSGMSAVNALLAGDVDIATAAEFVIVRNVLAGKNIRGIGCIAKTDDVFIVGRKDRGIGNNYDLKGKKIGVTKGTVSEFFLGRYLALHGIDRQNITLVDLKLSQLVDSLVKGDLDAAIMWEPYVFYAENQLGTNAITLPAQSGQYYYWVLITRDDFLKEHPTVTNRFIRSMAEAHDFIIAHPAEAKGIVQQRLQYDSAYMEKIWPENQFLLSLDQSLIIAMDDEARWTIKNNLTDKKDVPVFMDYISRDDLDAIRPEAVNIIR